MKDTEQHVAVGITNGRRILETTPGTLEYASQRFTLRKNSLDASQPASVLFDLPVTEVKKVNWVDYDSFNNLRTAGTVSPYVPAIIVMKIVSRNGDSYRITFNSRGAASHWVKKFKQAGIKVTDWNMPSYGKFMLLVMGITFAFFIVFALYYHTHPNM